MSNWNNKSINWNRKYPRIQVNSKKITKLNKPIQNISNNIYLTPSLSKSVISNNISPTSSFHINTSTTKFFFGLGLFSCSVLLLLLALDEHKYKRYSEKKNSCFPVYTIASTILLIHYHIK
jgi:hypothetical protein